MNVVKSSRHQGIIGKFGEMIICNWLSRSGFEVTVVDHTGIDIVAYDPKTKRRLGITVKSRTRNVGKEATHVNLLSYQKGKDDRQRVLAACQAFACEPWIAVYVETADSADAYMTSLAHYDATYRSKGARALDAWKMGEKHQAVYARDPNVKHVHIRFEATNWW
jgi:hypothetical protein